MANILAREEMDEKRQAQFARAAAASLRRAAGYAVRMAQLDMGEIRTETTGNIRGEITENIMESRSELGVLNYIRLALIDIMRILQFQLDESRFDANERRALARLRGPIERQFSLISAIARREMSLEARE